MKETEEKSLVPVRHYFVLGKMRYRLCPFSLPFIAKERRTLTGYITFILCPFRQRYASISYLLNTYFLGYSHRPTYTLNMYNTSKLAPARKGRFTHTIPRFRLGTVLFTTFALTKPCIRWYALEYPSAGGDRPALIFRSPNRHLLRPDRRRHPRSLGLVHPCFAS